MAKPKLRFPEFTNEWEEKQLKDFMVFKNGLNADKDKFGSGIKFISVMDILNNPFITYDIIRGKVDVDEKTLDNYSVTYGDVLFQRSSETREDAGKSNVYLDKKNTATFGGFVIRGKKTGDYSPEFMNSLLKSPKVRKEITSKAQGAQHINVGQETLENVSVVLPTIKEQERIAEFLSSIDDIIQVQGEEITALEEQKKGMMQKLFNREVRFKADDGSEYPEWESKQLKDNFEIVIDNRGKTPPLSDKGYPLIEIGAVGSFFVNYDAIIKYVDENTYHTWFRNHLKRGDILFSTVGTTAMCSYYDEKEVCCVAQNIVGLRFDNDCDSRFMFYLLSEDKNNRYIKSIQMNGVQPSIKVTQFIKLFFQIPCLREQQKIADCLSTYDEAIQIKKDKLEVWKKIKKGLLQQMFV